MNKYLLLLWALAGFAVSALAQTLPFSVHLEPLTIANLQGVQSYAFGQHNGKWLIVSGRTDGLHKAMGMNTTNGPFGTANSNSQLIVVDPAAQQMWAAPVTALPTDIKEQLSSTNTQYFQQGNYLYVIGGYGYRTALAKHKTFDKVTAIDVPNTINAIINGGSFSNYIRQTTDTALQITGGQLEKIYDTYYLVGGQNFEGNYMANAGMGTFTQTYSNQIKKFTITDNGTTFTINHLPGTYDAVNLHRRDYNMVQQIMPNGEEGLTAFSGVFQPTADIPYLNCVNIDSSGHTPNNAFTQYYNHYQCANMPMYAEAGNNMYTLFFGGIAQYYDSAGIMVQDNNVPFVKTIACVTRNAAGVMAEYKLPVELPGLLGAGSEFIPEPALSYYNNQVLKFDALPADTTLVGYIYGGISSPKPNVFADGNPAIITTSATSNIFKVYVVKNGEPTGLLPNTQNAFQLQVYPNPGKNEINVLYNLESPTSVTITITNYAGQVIQQQQVNNTTAGNNTYRTNVPNGLSAGVYYVTVESANNKATQKLIIR
jgi:hypothetical protein